MADCKCIFSRYDAGRPSSGSSLRTNVSVFSEMVLIIFLFKQGCRMKHSMLLLGNTVNEVIDCTALVCFLSLKWQVGLVIWLIR